MGPKSNDKGLPWRSSGQDSTFSLQGAQVQFLVKELRSYESLSAATHTKETAKKHHAFSATLQDFSEINFTAQTPVLMSQRCICVSLL